jgi:hypothetical protein
MTYVPSPTIRRLYFDEDSNLSDDERKERERLFFSRIGLKNGVFKTTEHNRLDDLNEKLVGLLPRPQRLKIMDVAVSSGISTLEWVRQLEREGFDFEMTAGDLSLKVSLYSLGRGFQVLVDSEGFLLQIDVLGMSFPNASGTRFRNTIYKVFRILSRVLFFVLGVRDTAAESCQSFYDRFRFSRTSLNLVSPALLEDLQRMTLLEDDISTNRDPSLSRQFDVVRAANVLNRVYFDDATLTRMVFNLKDRLVPGGLLIVCRTDEEQNNHGSIFRLNPDDSFEVLDRIGNGSEIEDLI